MSVYTVELSDGRRVKVEGDRPPTEEDVLSAMGGGGSPEPPQFDLANWKPDPIASAYDNAELSAGLKLDPVGARDTEFTRSLFFELPRDIQRGFSSAFAPIEQGGARFFNQLRAATAPQSATITGDLDAEPIAAPGEPMIDLPVADDPGALGAISRFAESLSTPGNVLTLPFAPASRAVQSAFALQAASGVPGAVEELARAKTDAEARGAFADIGLQLGMVGLMGRGLLNNRLTRGDILDMGSRELLKEVNSTAMSEIAPMFGERRLGIPPAEIGRAATDALAAPEAQAAVDLAYRQMQPGHIRLPWEPEGVDLVAAQRGIDPVSLTTKENAGGGRISFASEAGAEAVPSARQSAIAPREAPSVIPEKPATPAPETPPPTEPTGTPVETPPAKPPGGSGLESVTEGIDFANIQRPHRVGVERGLTLTEADVPVLEQQRKAAYDAALDAGVNSPEMFKAAFGKGVYLEGVIEGAKRKGPNYEFYLKEQSATVPEGVPTQRGTTETPPATDWATTLERWKFPEESINPQGQLFSLPHPDAIKAIGKIAWNNAIDVAVVSIKAGKLAREAIDNAIVYLKKTVQGFDEGKIRESLSKLLEMEGPRVEGTETKMRKSATRATASEQVPAPVQERIAQAPESSYKVQPMKAVEETVSTMPDAELAAVPEKSNIHVAAKLELSKRLFDAGKLDEGYEVFKSVSKTGTDFGQNINQFKFLKGQNPLNLVHVANQGLKEAGRDPLTKAQAEKLGKVASESIEANKVLDKAKDDWLKEPTDANTAKADAAKKAADEADLKTQRELAGYKVKTWPQMLKAFAQGNPLTPISQVANVVGNSLGAAMEAGSRGIGGSLDAVRSMLTGGERNLAVRPVRGTVEAAKGFGRGAAQIPGIMAKGSGDVVKGETRAQLQPLRSLVKAFAKNPDVPTVGGKVPFNERARMAVEGVFGITPEVMLRMLAAADKPAYEAARARLISEQSKLQKLSSKDASMAQKFPELFFDRETLQRIADESSAAVFQRKSKTVSYLESLIKEKGGDWADLAFTVLVAPYRLTPWNLVGRTLAYNPLVAAARVGIESAKGNIRGAELNAGRMVVGGMLYTAGYFLYKNGLIGPSLDDRSESQKSRLLAGEVLPPNHVNIDGLRRLVSGGDPAFLPGDETWDLTRGGGAAGAILTTTANIGRDFERKPEQSQEWLGTLLKNSTLEQASFTVNQSFLKGVTGILDAVRDRNLGPYVNSVENMLLNVGTPNTLSTISRATREYVPDLSADKLADEFENVVRNRFGVAGMDDYLPLKRDLWGKPMLQTPEGRNALLYHLFDISKNKQVTDDPVALELYQVWRTTGDGKAIPSIPMRSLTLNNDTYLLNPEQYSRYSELVGQYRRQITEMLVTNPNWQNLDNENKIKVLDSAYDQGQEIGKALLLKESLGEMAPKPKRAGFTPAK